MVENESEVKMILEYDEMIRIEKLLKINCSKYKSIIQINYYYDTAKFDLFYNNITMRVRQINNDLKFQYKYGKIYNVNFREAKEISQTIYKLPNIIRIMYEDDSYNLLGSLLTKRINYELYGCTICLDTNIYLGKVDNELEIEFSDYNNIDKISNLLKLNHRPNITAGKYGRFIHQYQKILGDAITVNLHGTN